MTNLKDYNHAVGNRQSFTGNSTAGQHRVASLRDTALYAIGSIALWMLLFVGMSTTARAQLPVGTILGTVKDPIGAVVAGAKITVHNTDTGYSRSISTAGSGDFRFDALPVGNYEVRAELEGFKQGRYSGISLSVGQQAVADFALEVGAVTQEVDVRTGMVAVDTTSGESSALVDEKQMTNLPLNGRNYIQLALIQPGAVEIKDHPTGSAANLGTTGTFFSANGAPPRANGYLLDGTSLTVYGGASGASISGSTLGLDGIREFRIVTNTFSAEYGMVMGSQMLMVSKSGANHIHGTVFEFLRNSAMDAANQFDTAASSGKTLAGAQRRIPPFKRNNFGGSIGGPIRKDKLFYFADYEGLREVLGTTNISNTIPVACRGAVGDTITSAACPILGTPAGVTSETITSPIAASWLPLYPLPNINATQTSWSFSQPTVEDYGQARLDYTISTSDNIYGRYTIDNTTQNLAAAMPGYPSAAQSRGQFLTLSEAHTFSPILLNTARFSFSRSNLINGIYKYVSGPGYSFVAGAPMGSVSISSVTGLSAGGLFTSQGLQDVFSYSDDLYYTRGRNSLKFGTLINHYQVHSVNGLNTYGTLAFTSLYNFYNFTPSSWTAIIPPFVNYKTVHYQTIGFYGQDDLKATSRLTLNLGMRYEFNTNINEIHGNQAAIRDLQNDIYPTLGLMMKNPSYLNFSPRTGFAWDVRGDGKTAIRGGVALVYNIAGWVGIMHQATREAPFVNQVTINNPATTTIPLNFPATTALTARSASPYDYNMKQSKILQYNLTVQRQLPWQLALTMAYVGSRGYNLMQFSEGNPTIPSGVPGLDSIGHETCVARPTGYTPLNLAQQNYTDGTANTCYLGTVGGIPASLGGVPEPRLNPNWGTFNSLISARGNSLYNGLQVTLQKSFAHGLQLQSNFTWSRVMDDTQGQSNSDTSEGGSIMAQDPLHPELDWGPASFNLKDAFRLNALYSFPEIKGANRLVRGVSNGWSMSVISSVQSGFPFETSIGSSRSRSNSGGNVGGNDRPNVASGRMNSNITRGVSSGCSGVAAGTRLGTRFLYYDPCAFAMQPAGFFGNEGRNSLTGPNFQDVDVSAVKDTRIGWLGEQGMVEFRAEVFNIQNRANYYIPPLSVFAGSGAASNDQEATLGTAGRITAAFPSRQVQLALKVIF